MKKRYFMGIDMAKASFDFCLLCRTGKRLWQGRFNNNRSGIEEFFVQLLARGGKLSQIHFALEATGVYGKALVAALQQRGLAVSVLNPAQVKFFALSVLRRTKNDTVDAWVIARFCQERKPMATRPLRPIEEQLNLLVHERESRVGEQNRERNRAKKDPYHPELPELIRRQRQGRLKQLKSEIGQLETSIYELINADQALSRQSNLLCSIPGIAQLTAAKLLAQLAGKEFQSARQLAAYAGLTPAECRSGGNFYGHTHLAKLATPSCAKPSICQLRSLGAGAHPSSLGSLPSKVVNSTTSQFAAPSCANSSTSLSAFLDTNNLLILPSFLCLKPLDPQDRIYRPRAGSCLMVGRSSC
jgi:transposase